MPIATGLVGMAKSADGVVWEKIDGDGPLSECFAPPPVAGESFDGSHVAVGDVVQCDNIGEGSMLMYYFGGGTEATALVGGGTAFRGVKMAIGRASSNDGGRTWRREGSALISPREGEQMFVGWPTTVKGRSAVGGAESSDGDDLALLDEESADGEEEATTAGEDEDEDEDEVEDEVEDADSEVLFYHACDLTDGGKFAIARATWTGSGFEYADQYALTAGAPGTFDAGGVSARSVVAHPSEPSRWLMAYEAQSEARRHTIGLALSVDEGVTWTRVGDGPIFEPGPEGAWDDGAVARPCLVLLPPDESAGAMAGAGTDGPRARLFYLGRSADGTQQGIGIAECASGDWTEFVRL